MPARIATALATAAAVWCLESAHLLSARAALFVVTLLLLAETAAAGWPVPTRRIGLPAAVVAFGVIGLERIRAVPLTDVASARPLGAFLTAGALVVLSLAGGQRRDLFARMGLLVAAMGLALTAEARSALIPAVALGLACGAAMVALERAALVSAPTAAQFRVPPPPLARTRLIAAPLAATVALAGFLASNATLPKHPPHTTFGAPSGFGGSSGSGSSGGSSSNSSARTRLDPSASVMDLRVRGSLSNQPVARITPVADNSGPQLWRAAVMEGYDGTNWYVAENSDPVTAEGAEQIDEVRPESSYQLPLLTSGTAVRLITSNSSIDDPQFPETVDGGYQVTSVVSVATDAQLDSVPKAATPEDEQNVDTPRVPGRVLELARQLTANATTRRQAVTAVVSYLHSHESYRLDSPVPAKGTDAVDDFLFRSHTGFCEQFASAAAILLQASGVPTRVVTGYASGQREPDGSWLLRGSDAHAWIEVEYPEVGWVPVDPTAGARLASTSSAWHWRPLAAVGSIVVLLGLVFAGLWLVRRRRALRADPLRHSLTVLDAALGSARRQPAESLRDLAARVPLSPDERGALGTAERAFYGASPVAASEIHSAAATMRRTARRLRRERVIPRRRRPRH